MSSENLLLLKVILVIVFSVLAIVSYILCKSLNKNKIVSVIAAVVSVLMLVAVIITGHFVKVDKDNGVKYSFSQKAEDEDGKKDDKKSDKKEDQKNNEKNNTESTTKKIKSEKTTKKTSDK